MHCLGDCSGDTILLGCSVFRLGLRLLWPLHVRYCVLSCLNIYTLLDINLLYSLIHRAVFVHLNHNLLRVGRAVLLRRLILNHATNFLQLFILFMYSFCQSVPLILILLDVLLILTNRLLVLPQHLLISSFKQVKFMNDT